MQFTTMKTIFTLLILFVSLASTAQVITINEAIDVALRNNPSIRAAAGNVAAQRELKRTGFDLPKTEVILMRGQYNSYAKDDNNISIMQTLPFTAFGSQGSLNRAQLTAAELAKIKSEHELIYSVRQVYYQLLYLKARRNILLQQDSLFEGFYKSSSLRFRTGETNLLEQATAESQRNESKNAIFQIEADILVLREQLKALLNSTTLPDTPDEDLRAITFEVADTVSARSNPALAVSRQEVVVADASRKVTAARFAPDLLVGYFNQTLIGAVDPVSGEIATKSDRFSGFQVGLAIPLWFVPHQARVKAARYATEVAQQQYENQQLIVRTDLHRALREYEKNKRSLEYYEQTGLPNSLLIIKQAKTAFREGEAGYMEYLLGIKNAIQIQENYLRTLNDFNQTIILLQFLTGNE